MVDGLMTALNVQKPPANDLRRLGAQMVFTLKMTLVT
jgi:hypothetical protein